MAQHKRRSDLLAAVASALALLGAAPAAAQYYYPAPRVYAPAPPPPPAYPAALAPHQVDAIVRSLGLTPVSPALPRGPAYVIHAAGREGSEVQVTIDRYSGRVVNIARLGRSAPRIAALPPGYEAPFDPEDDGPAIAEDDFPPAPGFEDEDERSSTSAPRGGPSVIVRQGIQSNDLPPPGQPRYAAPRDPDVTGSVPGTASRGPIDPLLGVPKEFRGQPQRTAARAPEPAPRATPMPRPRPADAPQVAQAESAPPAAKPDAKQDTPVAAPKAAPKVPDVQGFE